MHTKEVKELQQSIEKLSSENKLLSLNHERELSRIMAENHQIKSENAKLFDQDENRKEYRERCIVLEKTLNDVELKVALKDIELSHKQTEIDKLKSKLQEMDRAIDAKSLTPRLERRIPEAKLEYQKLDKSNDLLSRIQSINLNTNNEMEKDNITQYKTELPKHEHNLELTSLQCSYTKKLELNYNTNSPNLKTNVSDNNLIGTKKKRTLSISLLNSTSNSSKKTKTKKK